MMPNNSLFDIEQQPSKKSNEWYTPACYIEAAREVMNGIDLDPASCKLANLTVKATRYYTEQEDGLAQPWSGKVWLNPPFRRLPDNRSSIELFTRKLVEEYQRGHVTQAILLSTLRTETPWFRLLWEYPICFADHKVRFVRDYDTPQLPGRYTTGHMHGTLFVYLGPNEAKFIEIFQQFGVIAKRISPPRQPAYTTLSLWGSLQPPASAESEGVA